MIDMPLALTCLSASVPVTTAIIKFVPRRASKSENGRYVTLREFDHFRSDLGDRFTELKNAINGLEMLIKSKI